MKRPVPALRLRLPRIEKTPKPVYAARWHDYAGVARTPALQDELLDIIESIERGDGVPERHYRAGIDRDRDGLLKERGILHLHLGGPDCKRSDILVFLIQYADRVVLLETNSHIHFRTRPAGRNILALNQSWLGNLEHDMREAAARAQAASDDEDRRQAEAERSAIAQALDRFRDRTREP